MPTRITLDTPDAEISPSNELAQIASDLKAMSVAVVRIYNKNSTIVAKHGPNIEPILSQYSSDLSNNRAPNVRIGKGLYVSTVPLWQSNDNTSYVLLSILRRRWFQTNTGRITKSHILALRYITQLIESSSLIDQKNLIESAITDLLNGNPASDPFATTIGLLAKVFKCHGGSIWELHNVRFSADDNSQYLTLEATAGHNITDYDRHYVPRGMGILWKALAPGTEKWTYHPPLKKSELINPRIHHLFQERFLLLRLELNDTVYGVACLNGVSTTLHSGSYDALRTFERVAALEIHTKELERTRKIVDRLSHGLAPNNTDLTNTCRAAAENLRELLGCQAVSIFLRRDFDITAHKYDLAAVAIAPEQTPSQQTKAYLENRIPITYSSTTASLTQRVITSAQPLIANAVSKHPGNSHKYREIAEIDNDTWGAAPLLDAAGNVIGVIRCVGKQVAIGKRRNYVFDNQDINILQHCANILTPMLQAAHVVRALKETNEGLAAAERIREHEIKGPLAVIGANAEFVRRYLYDRGVPSKERRLNEIISDATMCSFLLKQPRPPTLEQFNKQRQLISVQPILQEIQDYLQRQIRSMADVADNNDVTSKEPELIITPLMKVNLNGTAISPVSGNRHLLQRAFYNIAINAIKYGIIGGCLSISINEGVENSNITVDFEDNGIGIDDADLDHLFEMNYRGVRVRDAYPGEGIGLALAKKIIDLHGGVITITNPSKPTRIRVQLPQALGSQPYSGEQNPAILRWDIPKRIM